MVLRGSGALRFLRRRGLRLCRLAGRFPAVLERLFAGGVDELRCVLLVPVSARVCQRAEQAFCLGELGARAAILHLPGCAGESPDPAGEDLLGSVGLFLADRAQEDADALDAILLPGRRLGDERDEIVELDALVEADVATGNRRPVTLLVLVEVARVDPLPLARDHAEPPLHVGGDRHEPGGRRELSSGATLLAASRRRRDACAFAVE